MELLEQDKLDSFDIPDGWIICKFEDLFDFKGGNQPPKSDFIDSPQTGYVRLLQIRDFESDRYPVYIKENSRLPKCENDDLLIARYGASLGRVCSGKDGSYNVALVKILFDKERLDRNWVKLFLNSSWFQEPLFLVSRSAQNGFNKDEVFPRPVPLPPLNEQRRIVSTIEQLTDRSNKARAALEDVPKLIAQFRQSVLAAAFRGDLTADWREKNPDIEPASELLERTAIQLGENYQETRLSIDRSDDCLQKSWSWSKLKLVVQNIQAGKNFSCPEISVTKDTVGLAKISAVTWDKFNPQETKTVTDATKIDPRLFIESGDLLVSRANTLELVGASVVVEEIDYKIMLSDKVWRIHLIDTDKKYVHYYLKSSLGRKEIESRANGNQASMRNISQKAFQDIVIPIPPIEEQREIVRHIEDALATIDSIFTHKQAILAELNQLDRSILAKAFRGELVPQDPNDEPAAVLLDRIRAEREQTSTPKQRGKTTRNNSSKQLSIEGIE
jgi:type I restriction enzyme, S subunit